MKSYHSLPKNEAKMNSSLILYIILCTCLQFYYANCDNVQDFCPTNPATEQTIFMNGFPCKNPANITASDFKSSMLNHKGDTENFLRSSTTIVTAADYHGLNTLGLSIARTDLDVDGIVMPHSHPRASEILYVSQGLVIAGFIDTENQLFQIKLGKGDVFLFPKGLLHFCLNSGYEIATVFSVLNSQNPGVVKIADAMFGVDQDVLHKLVEKIKSVSAREADGVGDAMLSGL